MSGLENEHKLYFQIAAFKIIHGGHYIIGPRSNKVAAGNGMVIPKLCYCKVLLRKRNFKGKSRKEETFVLYHLQLRKSGNGGAHHWRFQSIGVAPREPYKRP